ncbi:hypothetical protein AM493_08310 [Flavobacterium akiainvivens]|uniref:YEATS-Like-Associating Three TM domain-containing protein n=1 Tax=Flavobacterium akiainvivens TaxID=1202724 RepID=A0A0M8MH01_9FLAO|nr:YEATS-associated helix-containing protein [Flavobacterium akiainvivens]KOS06041.1 hypothetical protein AM493_08310 [Flavobacterium akiainvivens]SFQ54463.1 hypothetical protein SAMN05444144_107144 [Flavobacterium akiainvivens]
MSPSVIIILIISLSGILGGLTNFYTINEFKSKKESQRNLIKSILLGICASCAVPLFLQVLSNNLLDIPTEEITTGTNQKYPIKNYFILAGFCIIAAVYSKRFLDDLYDKINKTKQEVEEVKKSAEQAKEVSVAAKEASTQAQEASTQVANFIELELAEEADDDDDDQKEQITLETIKNSTPLINGHNNIDEADLKKVLKNMQDSKFKDRSINGLIRGTKLSEEKIKPIIQSFIENNVVNPTRWYGKEFYRLTRKGKKLEL